MIFGLCTFFLVGSNSGSNIYAAKQYIGIGSQIILLECHFLNLISIFLENVKNYWEKKRFVTIKVRCCDFRFLEFKHSISTLFYLFTYIQLIIQLNHNTMNFVYTEN